MRLFVAVPVPEALRMRLAGLCADIRQGGLVPVRAQNMHLTLKFIGEVDESEAEKIAGALKAIRFAPFSCSLKGVGAFPDEDHARVVWVGCESGGRLEALAKDVMGALRGYGDDKPFSAHLTIARIKRKIELKAFMETHHLEPFGEFEAKEFLLMMSVLRPGGPEYSVLATFEAE